MRYKDLESRRARKLAPSLNYSYCYYLDWDYSILNHVLTRKRNGSKSKVDFAEAWIMLDTETSRSEPLTKGMFGRYKQSENYVVAFTLSIRIFGTNVCTLRGSKPSEVIHMLKLIRKNLPGRKFYVFIHNMSYDWTFLRRFFVQAFGIPKKEVNIKSHYPMLIEFENGMILRDSLILAGVSIEKWGENLQVDTRKAVGCWDYEKIRHQNTILNEDELKYIECDTLTGVECLNKLADNLGDTVVSIPFTSTGITRRECRLAGRKAYAKQQFNKQLITFQELDIFHEVFHGGYTHSNRHINGFILEDYPTKCEDFKSSYPFSMLTERVPTSVFVSLDNKVMDPRVLVKKGYVNAYIFKFVATRIRLKDPKFPMPPLQSYKCLTEINAIKDNGRTLEADYVEIWMNEVDLRLICEYYIWDEAYCCDIRGATKTLMPKWFRDEVFKVFKEKCELEYEVKILGTGDKSKYNLKKAQLNSLYGMCVTFPIRPEIVEVFEPEKWKGLQLNSGDYYEDKIDMKKKFDKYLKDWNQILPYIWGVYVTSWSQYHLFELSKCIRKNGEDARTYHWFYSDTDSIYSDSWDEEALSRYNSEVKKKLIDSGYGPVKIEDKEFWLGIAEEDGVYEKFITQGAKRYAVQKDGKIKITVAGVPKKTGASCLKDLSEFEDGFTFKGEITGKKLSTYCYQEIHENEFGDECADYIDLTPNDYKLSVVPNDEYNSLEGMIFNEELELVQIQFYEE